MQNKCTHQGGKGNKEQVNSIKAVMRVGKGQKRTVRCRKPHDELTYKMKKGASD